MLLTDWRVVLQPRLLTAVVVVAAVGVSLNYLYLPLRAAQYPPINEGEPMCRACSRRSRCSAIRCMDVLNRVQYGKPPW